MSERIQFFTDFVAATCGNDTCDYNERIQSPTPDQQKGLVRRARQHARRHHHFVSLERGQLAGAGPDGR